jgi:hypothetical protein
MMVAKTHPLFFLLGPQNPYFKVECINWLIVRLKPLSEAPLLLILLMVKVVNPT